LSASIDYLEGHIVTNHSRQVGGLERSTGNTVRISDGTAKARNHTANHLVVS